MIPTQPFASDQTHKTLQPSAMPVWVWCGLLISGLLFAGLFRPPISRAYIDFGDGNYQYISQRLHQGVRLYRDIMSPQPPFHLWSGKMLVQLAETLGTEPIWLFRWWTVSLRILTGGVLAWVAWRLFASPAGALLAANFYLYLPQGYRWGQGYQSETLQIFLLTFSLALILSRSKVARCLAPVAAIGAVWTNMSALPFAGLLVILAVVMQPVMVLPLVTAALTLAGLTGLCVGLAGNAYFENVWSNQIASFPADFWGGLVAKLSVEGTAIVQLEGPVILCALLGLVWWLRPVSRAEEGGQTVLGCAIAAPGACCFTPAERVLLALHAVALIGSGIYVVKGGTVDYIFSIGEPAVALFAAGLLAALFRVARGGACTAHHSGGYLTVWLERLTRVIVVVGVVAVLAWGPWRLMLAIQHQSAPGASLPPQSQGRVIEFSDSEVGLVRQLLERYCQPGETIWAPPFLAAVSGHPIATDLSETYLWYVRWHQSIVKGVPDPAVVEKIKTLTSLVAQTELPILVLNSRKGQWGHLMIPDLTLHPGITVRAVDPLLDAFQSALETNYHPLRSSPDPADRFYLQGWNERLEFWVPKTLSPLL